MLVETKPEIAEAKPVNPLSHPAVPEESDAGAPPEMEAHWSEVRP